MGSGDASRYSDLSPRARELMLRVDEHVAAARAPRTPQTAVAAATGHPSQPGRPDHVRVLVEAVASGAEAARRHLDALARALDSARRELDAAARPLPASGPAPPAPASPQAARLAAIEAAVAGATRDEVARELHGELGIADAGPILDDVFGAGSAGDSRMAWGPEQVPRP